MHKQLDVWNVSVEFVTDIYALSKMFPADEKFGLTNQLRRAAVSIPSNIAEGAARGGNREFIQFLYISLGSCAEVETQLLIAANLSYCDVREALEKSDRIKRMLQGLIKKKKHDNQ